MFALQRTVATVPRLQTSARFVQDSVLGTPPLVRISPTERIGYFFVMVGGMLAIPCYILVNLKHYRKGR